MNVSAPSTCLASSLASSLCAFRNSRVLFTADKDGTYYVVAGDSGDQTGTCTLSVKGWDDFAAGTGTADAVATGGSAAGELEHGYDRDWFAVTLEAGKSCRFDLKGRDTPNGSSANTIFRGGWSRCGSCCRYRRFHG